MHDVRLDAMRKEPAGEPEAVTTGLESDRDPGCSITCADGLALPALEHRKQRLRVRFELFQRLALNTRHKTCNEPT